MANSFDIRGFKRRPEAFKSTFKIKDNSTLTTHRISVLFPERYLGRELASIGVNFVKVLGIYAIVNDNKEYTVINTPIFHELLPESTEIVDIDGKNYVMCGFDKNSVYLSSNDLIVMDSFVYELFAEFFLQGNVPWYLDYTDLVNIFRQSKQFTNTSLGDDLVTWETITSLVTRYSSDKTKYHRQTVDKPYSYVGLNDIRYGYDNTGARIIGGYMKEGIVTAIIDKEKETSDTSRILRA